MSDPAALPKDLDTERFLLNAPLEWRMPLPALTEVNHFSQPHHRLIASAVLQAMSAGVEPSYFNVRPILAERGHLDDVGLPYLVELTNQSGFPRPTEAELEQAGVRLKQTAARRAAAILAIRIANAPAEISHADVEQLLGLVEQQAEDSSRSHVPPFLTLRERLARPMTPVQWVFDQLQPRGSRALLAAQYKAGKTTFIGNLARAWADHSEPLLGSFAVRPADGTFVVFDVEMSEGTLVQWYREQGIQNDDRVILLPMRGRASEFNILDRKVRAAWAAHLRSARTAYLVIDCARPIMDALGLDEHKEGGRFLVAVDALLAEANIDAACVVQHMGHANERARGDSRFRDWPDAEWQLVRKNEESNSPRYFKAYGRDVDVPESQLHFDPDTRRLSIVGGSRQDARTDSALRAVVDVIEAGSPDGLTGRAVKRALDGSDHPRDAVEKALERGCASGVLLRSAGPRHSYVYRVLRSVPVSASVPPVSRNSVSECPAAFIRRDARTLTTEAPTVPEDDVERLV